jgi:undecaprenyl pyrophosphate phosphatase UppP
MIHTVPAFIFGILFFQEAFQEAFPFYFIMIPVIIASVFFAVDEIYIRENDKSTKFLFQ